MQDLRARAAVAPGRLLRLWCNAASTGEEPYSLAMTAVEALGASARVQIVCSDIDTRVLATARRGVYAADVRGLSPERLRRHFLRGTGANAGSIRVRPEVARLVEFRSFNLMSTDWTSLGEPFDAVFCRNVMIYFDAPTQRRVLERIHAVLRPGGSTPRRSAACSSASTRCCGRAGCSTPDTRRTSATRATCSGCGARRSTNGRDARPPPAQVTVARRR